jgi:hypothetical protein
MKNLVQIKGLLKFIFIATGLAFLPGPSAMAQTDSINGFNEVPMTLPADFMGYRPYVGLRAGMADIGGNEYDPSAEYSFEIGFEPTTKLGLAIEYSFLNTDPENSAQDLTRSKLLLKGLYNFKGRTPFIRYSYVGVGAGPVWDKNSKTTNNEFGVAPMIGFDIPIYQRAPITLGANANYLFIQDDDVPDVFAVNGAVKYWF